MNPSSTECFRCGRPAPPPESSDAQEWQVIGATYVCDRCLTAGDYLSLADDAEVAPADEDHDQEGGE
jgi:hypothetical protein